MTMCLRWKVTVTLLLGLLDIVCDSGHFVWGYGEISLYHHTYEQPSSSRPYVPKIIPQPPNVAACPITVLRLTRVGLQRISLGFIDSSAVVELHLDDNNITEVSCGVFETLPNLRILNLSKNNIPTSKLLSFGKHDSLHTVYLDDNKGNVEDTELVEICGTLPKLLELYLRRNDISRFGVQLPTFAPRLTHLYLDGNRIESTEFLKDASLKLKHLHMDDNRISRIEEYDLNTLHDLSLSGNMITQLCRSSCKGNSSIFFLGGLRHLKKLNVSRNQIAYIADDAFMGVEKLEYLDLSSNRLEKLVTENLDHLKHLLLANNYLTSMPSMNSLTSLTYLDLNNNWLTTVSYNCLADLHKLDTLLLASNRLSTVKANNFNKLTGLKTLDLSNNMLMNLPYELINTIQSLQVLYLKNNSIANVHPLREVQSYIRELHLQYNPLLQVEVVNLIQQKLPRLVLYLKDADEIYRKEDDNQEKDYNEKDSEEKNNELDW